jgi:hypothetical protein
MQYYLSSIANYYKDLQIYCKPSSLQNNVCNSLYCCSYNFLLDENSIENAKSSTISDYHNQQSHLRIPSGYSPDT